MAGIKHRTSNDELAESCRHFLPFCLAALRECAGQWTPAEARITDYSDRKCDYPDGIISADRRRYSGVQGWKDPGRWRGRRCAVRGNGD